MNKIQVKIAVMILSSLSLLAYSLWAINPMWITALIGFILFVMAQHEMEMYSIDLKRNQIVAEVYTQLGREVPVENKEDTNDST